MKGKTKAHKRFKFRHTGSYHLLLKLNLTVHILTIK